MSELMRAINEEYDSLYERQGLLRKAAREARKLLYDTQEFIRKTEAEAYDIDTRLNDLDIEILELEDA